MANNRSQITVVLFVHASAQDIAATAVPHPFNIRKVVTAAARLHTRLPTDTHILDSSRHERALGLSLSMP